MVSQHRPAKDGSRERLLAAAADEFAARGFDGAKVDRIADRARVNKAMLYYHFDDKAALYREILRDLFSTLAVRLAAAAEPDAPPEDQIRSFIRLIAQEMALRPHYPAIWLREMAESGRHLDGSILEAIGAIIGRLADILGAGRRQGVFGAAHPVVVQMTIVAPLLLFAASAPVRQRFSASVPGGASGIPTDVLIAHVEAATLSALTVGRGPARLRTSKPRARRPARTSSSRRPH